MLFLVYTTRQRNFALYVTGVIFTCKYFKFGLNTTGLSRVVRKIESSRKDGKSNRGDFLIFVFLTLVKLSYARSEKPAHLTE